MPACSCGRAFCDASALHQHQEAKHHCFCHACQRPFPTTHGLEQHNLALHNWLCGHCSKKFSFPDVLRRHQKSTGHCYCRDCNRFFIGPDALNQHRRSALHVSEFRCCDCDRDFTSERALEQHLTDKVHRVTRTQSSNRVCWECDREFGDERALEQHRTSLVHRPISNIKCIAGKKKGRGCQRRFSSPSALLHHLESGACPSGVTRQKLNMVIQENDTDGIISNPYEIMRGTLLDATRPLPLGINTGVATPMTDSDDGVVFTPSSTSTGNDLLSPGALTPTSGHSSTLSIFTPPPLSRNRCPLCPPSRPPFSDQKSLQQHLSSPAHTSRLFHCPTSLLPNPPSSKSSPTVMLKSFSTLSGLAQHLESGACEGGTETFRRAAKYIEIRLKEMGVTTVTLLK